MENCEVVTYLPFGGCCEEALNAYIGIFGGGLLFLSRWNEKNCGQKNFIGKVMHAEFVLGKTRLAGGDVLEAETSAMAAKLMIHLNTEEEVRKIIGLLEKGGSVISALAPHPEPDDGGMGCIVRDKFGVSWILTCPNPKK
ncbi:MAG: VOC family protein [Treponemataceae bacterium]|nr:VOC family protein [Treponemataceae bacterium]